MVQTLDVSYTEEMSILAEWTFDMRILKARNKMSGFSQQLAAGGRAAHAGNIFDSF
jgi:hypothetical protein